MPARRGGHGRDSMPPKVIAKPDRGVLPVSATARAPKPPAARLKLEIRRLPPGLTLTEFEDILGPDWKLGNGKIDWREYRQGKIKSPGKLPEQSRCYLHFKTEPLLAEFEARFLSIVFHDKAGTHRLTELRQLPPTLGFAPNQRTPLHAKQRADNRQGTIDQDPEFIAFLEAETQPIVKPAALENNPDKEKEDIKTTPLIDDLRERKANKAKAAASKAEREKEKKKAGAKSKDKDKDKDKEKDGPKDKEAKEGKTSQVKAEKGPKPGAKILTKPASKQNATEASAVETKTTASETPTKKGAAAAREKKPAPGQSSTPRAAPAASTPAPQRQRQRGNNLEGIKKQLQKDLGVKASTSSVPAATDKPDTKPPTTNNTPSQTSGRPVSRSSNAPANNRQGQPAKKASPQTPAVPSTKAYLKHANPSQGITEDLIRQSLTSFGEVTSVTIDLRKGTAVAVFKDSEALKKAMDAKRVNVANGAVEVLEFKERLGGGGHGGGATNSGGGRGGSRAGRGGRGGQNKPANTNASNSTPSTKAAPSSAAPAPPPAAETAPSAVA